MAIPVYIVFLLQLVSLNQCKNLTILNDISTIKYDYNKFYFNESAAKLSWKPPPNCSPNNYQIIISSKMGYNIHTIDNGNKTSITITRKLFENGTKITFVRAIRDSAICAISDTSLQVLSEVQTIKLLIPTEDICIRPSIMEQTVIWPILEDESCSCHPWFMISQCSCVINGLAHEVYNRGSMGNKTICWKNLYNNSVINFANDSLFQFPKANNFPKFLKTISESYIYIVPGNSGSGCDKDLLSIDPVYQTIEIDHLRKYLKWFFISKHAYNKGIHIDIYEFGKPIYSAVLNKTPLLLVSLEYLTDELSYISLYYDEKDASCPQKYVHYNVYHLIKSGGVAVSTVMEGQPACFEFPTEAAEVVLPVDLNFQEYCKCTMGDFENRRNCTESKLIHAQINNSKVCIYRKNHHANQISVFFQETKVNGCGTNCDLINLLTGHRIDFSSVPPFSFNYNQLILEPSTAIIEWFSAECVQTTRYELITANNSILSYQLLESNTSTSVIKTDPASRYYVRAFNFDNSLCSTSVVSLQVSLNVYTTSIMVLPETNDPMCLHSSRFSSAIIMPQKRSNLSCTCTDLMNIEHCSCIKSVEFDVFYNSESDNQLCFRNITRNNTRIHFTLLQFNSLDDQSKGFPLYNQVILNSFIFVIPSELLPPIIINFLSTNKSICFVDKSNGFLHNTIYLINIVDITGYTTIIVHDATEPNCHQFRYNTQPSEENNNKFYCGSLKVSVRSQNDVILSSLNTNILESGSEGEICNCFNQNVKISMQIYDSTTLEILCSTNYVDFYDNSKLLLSIEKNNETVYQISVYCFKNTTIPNFITNFKAIIFWMPNKSDKCMVEQRTIMGTRANSSKSTNTLIVVSMTAIGTLLIIAIITMLIMFAILLIKDHHKKKIMNLLKNENRENE